jgi:hypothetical protein
MAGRENRIIRRGMESVPIKCVLSCDCAIIEASEVMSVRSMIIGKRII